MLTENQTEVPQNVDTQPIVNDLPPSSAPSFTPETKQLSKKWMVLSLVLMAIVLGLVGYILSLNKENPTNTAVIPSPDAMDSVVVPTENSENLMWESKWLTTIPSNKVLHIGSPYLINVNNPEGSAVEQFNPKITKKMEGDSISTNKVSPDKKKVLFTVHDTATKTQTTYIATIDGRILEEVNIENIKNELGGKYAILIEGWSLDSQSLVINARDESAFVDENCCEGGDNRQSEQKVLSYNIDTHDLTEIFTINSAPIGTELYDPQKQIYVYSDFYGDGKFHIVDLKTKNQIVFEDNALINYSLTNTYFVTSEQEERVLKIYSMYEPTKAIGQVVLDEPDTTRYTNWVTWSPNNTFFAIKVLNKDNTRNDMVKIYDKTGNLVSSVITGYGDGSLFSDDEKFFLSSYTTNPANGQWVNNWEVIDVFTGEMKEGTISNPTIGPPIYWFN